MKVNLLHQLPPGENNPRNSEGAFIRGKQGEILFAYSRFTGKSCHDHAACDIALIVSYDEGRTWTEPRIIATAKEYGVENIMSVSALELKDGRICFFYLTKDIQENGISLGLARSLSVDGVQYQNERCAMTYPKNYYVVNNDRMIRLKSGRILAPAAYIRRDCGGSHSSDPYVTTCLYSDDEGITFH